MASSSSASSPNHHRRVRRSGDVEQGGSGGTRSATATTSTSQQHQQQQQQAQGEATPLLNGNSHNNMIVQRNKNDISDDSDEERQQTMAKLSEREHFSLLATASSSMSAYGSADLMYNDDDANEEEGSLSPSSAVLETIDGGGATTSNGTSHITGGFGTANSTPTVLSRNSYKSTSPAWSALKAKVSSGEMLMHSEVLNNSGSCLMGEDGHGVAKNGGGNSTRSRGVGALLSVPTLAGDALPLPPNSSDEAAGAASSARHRALEKIRNGIEFSLSQCLLAMAAYMAIAVCAYSFVFEQWSIIDSIYFSIVTFTTIGYGDLVPTTMPGRLFCCLFASGGVACLGIAIGILGSNLIEAQYAAVERTKQMADDRVMKIFGVRNLKKKQNGKNQKDDEEEEVDTATLATASTRTTTRLTTVADEDRKRQRQEEQATSSAAWQLCKTFFMVCVILVTYAIVISTDPGMQVAHNDVCGAIYYVLITATTVGYGDMSPTTQHGRLVAIVFIPLVVGAMGHFLSSVAGFILDAKQNSFRQHIKTHQLSLKDIEIMDEDGDGQVTRVEFLEFMLLAMNKVDKDVLSELRDYFDRLDVSQSGALDKDDLIQIAKKQLRQTSHKLKLQTYKQSLMAKAEAARVERERQQRGEATQEPPGHRRKRSFWNTIMGGGGDLANLES